MQRRRNYRAFTLVEMLMVVMIVGMLSSMAIPRIAQGSRSASKATLGADLAVARKAIILYAAEHGGNFPGLTADEVVNQLTAYTSATGDTAKNRGGAYIYGPYLAAIPACPVGPNTGNADILIDDQNSPPAANTDEPEGWVYNPRTGEFYANVGTYDQGGVTINDKAGAVVTVD